MVQAEKWIQSPLTLETLLNVLHNHNILILFENNIFVAKLLFLHNVRIVFRCSSSGIGKPTTTCLASSSLTEVKKKCDSKSFCQVYASNSVFGDPCVGTIKYLQVSYSCLPTSITFIVYA